MNDNLIKARKAKNDEFYTQLQDIEKELANYPIDTFKNKTIYLPCDIGENNLGIPKSNFIIYFEQNKEHLGYKKLIHTSIQEGYDFRSHHCTEILNEVDIVVTNPPFSLFREFIAWLMKNEKKFIILGDKNVVNYLTPYIKEEKLWIGQSIHSGERYFHQPDSDQLSKGIGVRWFTNIDYPKRYEDIVLFMTYKGNEEHYPKYDNYDAINCDKTKEIPVDYDDIIGVPITFLDKYNPKQFEIIGVTTVWDKNPDIEAIRLDAKKRNNPFINGKSIYPRVLIKRR